MAPHPTYMVKAWGDCSISAAAPARLCSRHPNTSRWCTTRAWQALAGGSSARVTHAVGTRGAVGATPRQLDVPRSADIICKVCLQDLVCPDVCLTYFQKVIDAELVKF